MRCQALRHPETGCLELSRTKREARVGQPGKLESEAWLSKIAAAKSAKVRVSLLSSRDAGDGAATMAPLPDAKLACGRTSRLQQPSDVPTHQRDRHLLQLHLYKEAHRLLSKSKADASADEVALDELWRLLKEASMMRLDSSLVLIAARTERSVAIGTRAWTNLWWVRGFRKLGGYLAGDGRGLRVCMRRSVSFVTGAFEESCWNG